jgi:hypothetical protein
MRIIELLVNFDAALEWEAEDPLLAVYDPPPPALADPWSPGRE